MMKGKVIIITVARQFGSGGKEIGEKAGIEKLGDPVIMTSP